MSELEYLGNLLVSLKGMSSNEDSRLYFLRNERSKMLPPSQEMLPPLKFMLSKLKIDCII